LCVFFFNINIKLILEYLLEVGYGTPGELCVRGPNIMKGYLHNKEATDSVFDQDGFFHTGDVASVDENGNYNLCIIFFCLLRKYNN
jgi:long-subunit acyl-CoA synthetase (AMP-forming)